MIETKRWKVDIFLGEQDGRTRAEARLIPGERATLVERDARPAQVRLVPLARKPGGVPLELGRPRLVSEAEMRDAAQQEIARVPDTRRGEVRVDRGERSLRLCGETRPVSERVRELEVQRHGVHAVMRGKAL